MTELRIARVPRVDGLHISLRDVEEADAHFIHALRLNSTRNRHLSPVSPRVEDQVEWIRRYRSGTGQAYFVVSSPDGRPLGTVRIYDEIGDSFSWGSWVLVPEAPGSAALESALLVYWLATQVWNFQRSHFNVDRDNTRVIAFHERCGATRAREAAKEISFVIGRAMIEKTLRRYASFLPLDKRLPCVR